MEATVVLTFSWWYLHSGSYHIDEYRSTKLCNMCSLFLIAGQAVRSQERLKLEVLKMPLKETLPL